MTLDDLERRIRGLPKLFKYSLLSQERAKLYGLTFGRRSVHSQGPSEQKPIKNFEEKQRGRIQGLPKVLSTSYYLRKR